MKLTVDALDLADLFDAVAEVTVADPAVVSSVLPELARNFRREAEASPTAVCDVFGLDTVTKALRWRKAQMCAIEPVG